MKQGWVEKKLGQILQIERGGSPRPIKKYLTDDPDGLNWIKIGDATASTKYIYHTKQKITKDGLHKTRLVKEGDFILSNSMSFGKPYIMKTTGCIHDGWLVLKEKDGFKLNQDFLYHLLCSPYLFKQFDGLAAGSTVRNLNIALVSSVTVRVPPLEEQKQIVAKLDQCFEAIDKARANAVKNLENAKELFQSKLNDIFSQKGEGWVEKKLGEISDVTYGFTDKSVEVGDFRYVRITDIDNNGELISTGKKYIGSSKDGKKFILKDNDILMARTGATFAKLLLYKDIEPSIFASYLIKIDFTESIDNEFYWFYAKSNSYWDQANTLSTGSAQPHFNGKALKQVLFPYPVSKTEQSRLINEFKRFQSKTQSLESKYQQELNSLEELKKSILQKAFEGEL